MWIVRTAHYSAEQLTPSSGVPRAGNESTRTQREMIVGKIVEDGLDHVPWDMQRRTVS